MIHGFFLLFYCSSPKTHLSRCSDAFHAAKGGREFDITTILQESLVEEAPVLSVTIIDNHDTQPLQALEAPPYFNS